MTEKLKAIIIEENKILKMHPRLNLFSNLLENKYFIVSKDNVINKSSESLLSSIKRLAEELHQQGRILFIIQQFLVIYICFR